MFMHRSGIWCEATQRGRLHMDCQGEGLPTTRLALACTNLTSIKYSHCCRSAWASSLSRGCAGAHSWKEENWRPCWEYYGWPICWTKGLYVADLFATSLNYTLPFVPAVPPTQLWCASSCLSDRGIRRLHPPQDAIEVTDPSCGQHTGTQSWLKTKTNIL